MTQFTPNVHTLLLPHQADPGIIAVCQSVYQEKLPRNERVPIDCRLSYGR